MIFTSEQPEEIKIYKGGFINQAGYYKGIINYAYDYIKPKGTAKNIVIDFVSNQGQSSLNYLNVSYFDKKGDEVENESNMKLIKAQLLPLLKIKKLESKKGIVSIRNKETKQNEDVEKMVYNQLADRNIGIWFKESIDENQINQKTGMPYVNYNIFAFFDYETGKTAHEIANNLPATTLADLEEQDEIRRVNKKSETQPKTQTHIPPSVASTDDFDDDIPF